MARALNVNKRRQAHALRISDLRKFALDRSARARRGSGSSLRTKCARANTNAVVKVKQWKEPESFRASATLPWTQLQSGCPLAETEFSPSIGLALLLSLSEDQQLLLEA